MNPIKKGLLYLAFPLLSGCSLNMYDTFSDPIYEDTLEIISETQDKNYVNKKDLTVRFDWNHSAYKTSYGYDTDGDGIINWDDPWPFNYGPFIDQIGNGIIDPQDFQVSGFLDKGISTYPNYWNFRWMNNSPVMYRQYYPLRESGYYIKNPEVERNPYGYRKSIGSKTGTSIYKKRTAEPRKNYTRPKTDYTKRSNSNNVNTRKAVKPKVTRRTSTYKKPAIQRRPTYNKSTTIRRSTSGTSTRRSSPPKKTVVKKTITRRR